MIDLIDQRELYTNGDEPPDPALVAEMKIVYGELADSAGDDPADQLAEAVTRIAIARLHIKQAREA